MQFLALTRRHTDRFTQEEFAAMLGPEADHARAFYADGTFRALYSRGDVPGAVIIIEAADAAEAARLVDSLPFARNAMMAYELVPLMPYRGFVPSS